MSSGHTGLPGPEPHRDGGRGQHLGGEAGERGEAGGGAGQGGDPLGPGGARDRGQRYGNYCSEDCVTDARVPASVQYLHF